MEYTTKYSYIVIDREPTSADLHSYGTVWFKKHESKNIITPNASVYIQMSPYDHTPVWLRIDSMRDEYWVGRIIEAHRIHMSEGIKNDTRKM